jgi:uncharacterized peroxidase-related enzyme
MAFIRTYSDDQAPPDVKHMYERYEQAMGYVPNYTRVFSHRPEVMAAWGNLNKSIRANMDTRRYELVTLAAAQALRSSYCMLAHGSILMKEFFSPEQLVQIAKNYQSPPLTQAEVAMMVYAEKIARDAAAVTQKDIDAVRELGFSDAEIFDIAATAAARCFFSKTVDALGTEADQIYLELEEELRLVLTVGRPISGDMEE